MIIKDYVREKRKQALENDNMSMIQIDWAENGRTTCPNKVQSGYFGGWVNFSLHTGYEYSKSKSGGFVSLSDKINHKAEAIFAALWPKIKELFERASGCIRLASISLQEW